EDRVVSLESLRHQMRALHNHPSMLVWLNGSDFSPPPDNEKLWLDTIAESRWPNPTLNSANPGDSHVSGYNGGEMTRPVMWVPPIVWYTDKDWSGAWSLATEIGTGAAIPPVESLKKFIPAEHLWPPDAHWWFHVGSGPESSQLGREIAAIEARY